MSFSEVMIVVVILSAVWVFLDARGLGIRHRGDGNFFDFGPTGWAIASLVLWIVVFPAYLVKRKRLSADYLQRLETSETLAQPKGEARVGNLEDIEVLAALRDKGLITPEEFEAKKRAILQLDSPVPSIEAPVPHVGSSETSAGGGIAKTLVGSLAVLLFIGALVWFFAGSEPKKIGEGKLGEPYKFDAIEFTVTQGDFRDRLGDDDGAVVATEGSVFLVVRYKYSNTSDRPIDAFAHPTVKLVAPNGALYEPDLEASVLNAIASDDTERGLSSVNPGASVSSARVFLLTKAQAFGSKGWKLAVQHGAEEMQVGVQFPSRPPTDERAVANPQSGQAVGSGSQVPETTAADDLTSLVETGFGVLQTRRGEDLASELMVNGKPFTPPAKGGDSMAVEGTVTLSDRVLVVVSSASGTACPAQYRVVTLSKTNAPAVTPEFGTCSDAVELSRVGDELHITLPGFMGPSESAASSQKAAHAKHRFVFRDGVVYENGAPVSGGQ